MDKAYIDSVEKHLLHVIQGEIDANGFFRKHADFAKAAFGDEVENYHGKWSRIRMGKNHLTISDLVRIGFVLNIEPSLLVAQAYSALRKEKMRQARE